MATLDPNCPVDQRIMEREAEKQKERQRQEVQRFQQQANTEAWNTWFMQSFDNVYNKYREPLMDAIAEFVVETKRGIRKDYEAKIGALDARLKAIEQKLEFTQQFYDLEQRLIAGQIARDEAKRASEMIPQGEALAKIEKLQRQVDDLEGIADLNARFRELAERVSELEKTNSLEARFTKLANEAKGGPEIQQRELEARIEGLQRQVDDLKNVAAQPGPQGPPGPPGKLPGVKEYAAGRVHYEADVVVHAGALWQASSDTVHPPPHSDWICIARAGRDGSDGRPLNVRGTYDAREKYERLDIVALDGAAFIARRDDPGICPGDGWQLLSRQGRPGNRGETGERGVRGDKGERGEPGATIVSWQLDRERYRISPLMSDGKVGPNLELRALFEQFLSETCD